MRFKLAAVPGLLLVPLMFISLPAAARAETVSVAVAANFAEAARAIGAAFKAKTGNDVEVSAGPTGGLYAQISQGAPLEVFLSADSATPEKAVAQRLAVAGTAFTYAVGKLVLFSTDPGLVDGEQTLAAARFARLAIADPSTAPYGAAAVEAMKRLNVYAALEPKIVTGTSIAQAYQFVASKNAELGFLALSQVVNRRDGSRWLVPQQDYAPITQDAVLLDPGRGSKAAQDFLAYLKSPAAVQIIKGFGYGFGSDEQPDVAR